MAYLGDVAWCTDASERHSKSKHKTASQKHPSVDGWSLYTCTHDDCNGTCEHACATSKIIVDWSAKEDGRDAANVIDRKCDTGTAASRVPDDVSIMTRDIIVKRRADMLKYLR